MAYSWIDAAGNVWARRGTSHTLFTAHTDTVAHVARNTEITCNNGIARLTKPLAGDVLGADDGAGVWLMLQMLDAAVPGTYVFFRNEEDGAEGSRWVAANGTLAAYKACVSFDRRGTTSVISSQGGRVCCSSDYAAALAADLNNKDPRFLFSPDPTGIFTDSAVLMDRIPECTNISVGYANEHHTQESLNYAFLLALAQAVKRVEWEKLPISRDPKPIYYGAYNYARDKYDYDGDDDYLVSRNKKDLRRGAKGASTSHSTYTSSQAALAPGKPPAVTPFRPSYWETGKGDGRKGKANGRHSSRLMDISDEPAPYGIGGSRAGGSGAGGGKPGKTAK